LKIFIACFFDLCNFHPSVACVAIISFLHFHDLHFSGFSAPSSQGANVPWVRHFSAGYEADALQWKTNIMYLLTVCQNYTVGRNG